MESLSSELEQVAENANLSKSIQKVQACIDMLLDTRSKVATGEWDHDSFFMRIKEPFANRFPVARSQVCSSNPCVAQQRNRQAIQGHQPGTQSC